MPPPDRLAITRLEKAAGVGIETVRYGPVNLVRRIGFIKKAQAWGFSPEEIATLLDLADRRNRRAVQPVNSPRLAQIETKLADPTRPGCEALWLTFSVSAARPRPCPITRALVEPATAG